MSQPSRGALAAASIVTTGALLGAGLFAVGSAASAAEPWDPKPSYTTTDAGDGTYTVPHMNSDVPDVSVDMVPAAENDEGRDIYYKVSTTMQLSPGAPIMKSYDLVNWEIVNYAFDRFTINDAYSLRNGASSYGQGQWASSLRYHDGTFYVLVNSLNLGGAVIYSTDDIENGSWSKAPLGRSLHDPSLFFDTPNGGTPYIVYGGVNIVRLNSTLTAIEQDYGTLIPRSDYSQFPYVGTSGLFEGAQAFYIDGYYYIVMITWPSSGRQVALFRSTDLLGRLDPTPAPYESRGVLNSNGFAQGSLVPVTGEDGELDWHGYFFRDTFPIGRVPALIPATWSDGWPTFGNNGVVPVNGSFDKPIRLSDAEEQLEQQKSIVRSDDFANDAPYRSYQDETWTIPTAPTFDPSLLGVNLVQNPGFEDETVAPWAAQFSATIAKDTTGPATGSAALLVSNRTLNGSTANQVFANKLQVGATYTITAKVKHQHTAAMTYNLCLDFGTPVGLTCTSTNNVQPGDWRTLTRTYTVPSNANVSNVKFAIETPWGNPQPATSSVSFLMDDVSIVGSAPTVEQPTADEIEPNGSNLDMVWQWNHAPDNRYWSLTDREGWLRLTTGKVVTGNYTHRNNLGQMTWLEEARNSLSQRTFGPTQSAEIKLDISGMNNGDVSGLAAYNRDFSYVAVKRVDGVNTVGVVHRGQPFQATINRSTIENFVSGTTADLGSATEVYLKADLDFARTGGQLWTTFYYSTDGSTWTQLGNAQGPLSLDGNLTHFMGHRVAIFNYATQTTGGHVDVDYFALSDVLTAENLPLDETDLEAAVAHAATLDEGDYPTEAWAAMQDALAKATAALAGTPGSQNQIDAPERELSLELAKLAVIAEGSVDPGDVTVDRIAGANRYEVAANISQEAYPDTAPVVYVASGANYPDALSAGPAAAHEGGPLLLVQPNAIPQVIADEIERLDPDKIVVVGGTASVTEGVFNDLSALTDETLRIAGANRYEVSRSIAEYAFGEDVPLVYLATGETFPDALAAGGAAGSRNAPVVLVRGSATALDDETADLLEALGAEKTRVLGGEASVSPGVFAGVNAVAPATRLGGANRYEAARTINSDAFESAERAFIATGLNFPDALAGSAWAAFVGAPLYVAPQSCVTTGVLADLESLGVTHVTLLGGEASLTPEVADLTPCA
ncbi:beta-xylosidase/putative cell wall-binding protein [Microbacteriaceae bacterium SG_E_30_P1]|uniref:Beta-xylosidase/putative cell wall-binding protein n=1 Tax=Antiquaquibacter oligotrophicus TaxID=2880260 RepID=A0ABT6KSK9_9MICO|nr:cell wall-binding repeat-containing protein [Antiquaquibacter oligotrophicus]MDH6182169.1 beta-xylosidase/putative cell wall-binding protein [Antiquaquibacter oligotrophicus]UDF12169.1 cell wall-binding repeat-containing protein [Antiquaquibacter oligotrophicus]